MNLMKRFAFTMLAFVLCAASVHAQDEELDSFDFDDVEEDFDNSQPYFAVAVGFTTTMHFGDFDGVNVLLQGFMQDQGEEISSPMLMTGWEAFLGLGFVENVRVGFTSMSGTNISEGTLVLADDATVDRRFQYSQDFQGLIVDYAVQVTNEFVVLPGIGVYFGNLEMNASQSSGNRSFESEFDFLNGSNNQHRLLEASHWSLGLSVDIEYAVSRFAMLRLNAGYTLGLSTGDWEVDKITSPVANAPDLDTSGLMLQAGVFIGLFN